MKIRSITYFDDLKYPLDELELREAGAFLISARAAYEAAGYEVQTLRLATKPFPRRLRGGTIEELPRVAQHLDLLIPQVGIGYISLGPAVPEVPRSYELIPEAIAATKNVFFGGIMADAKRGIDLTAVRRCAEVIVKCAPVDPSGFANLRFAALANVRGGSPFFPAAYHDGGGPAFALATEAADLAVEAFEDARTVEEGRSRLIASIEAHGEALGKTAKAIGRGKGRARFAGIDFSLAPFPDQAASLGHAMERLGVASAGLHGSLAAAAILTECIERAKFARTGFNGLMLPVLEDSVLARRAAEGTLAVKDLLLYSAVCGTGLDTVPLPGDATADRIAPLLLDLCALALRLNKPLTARLMPVPNKKAGELTGFDFAFFANSKVMRLESVPLQGPMNSGETFRLKPRGRG